MNTKQKPKMNKDIKVFFVAAIIVLFGFTLIILNMLKPKDIAVVGGNVISNNEFLYHYSQNVIDALQDNDSYTSAEEFLNKSYGDGTVADMIKEQTLNKVIQINTLLLNARKDGFKADKKAINEAWLTFKDGMQKDASNYEMTLQEYSKAVYGMSINKVENFHKQLNQSQQYMESKIQEIVADENELRTFYEENKGSLEHAAVRHILVLCAGNAKDDVVAEKKGLCRRNP